MKEGVRRSDRGHMTPLAGNPPPAWPVTSEPQDRESLPSPHSSPPQSPTFCCSPALSRSPALSPSPGQGKSWVILRLFLSLATVTVGFLMGAIDAGAGGLTLGAGRANTQPFASASPTLLFASPRPFKYLESWGQNGQCLGSKTSH